MFWRIVRQIAAVAVRRAVCWRYNFCRSTKHRYLKKMSRLANRTAEPWGVDRRFATLQRADCTVCFVYLLESYFRRENLSREQISFENCFKYYNYLLHLKIFSLIHGELVCHQLKQNCTLDWSCKKYGAIIRPLEVNFDS